uniref:Uncharacterized protein n=1 Tax=Arundo donax TaxID=35708 RepID=A0A0A9EZL3_ARUDO
MLHQYHFTHKQPLGSQEIVRFTAVIKQAGKLRYPS